MNKSLLLLISVALLSSCMVTQKMAVTAPVEDIGVHQYPTVADLDVKPQKVSKTEEWNFVPFNIGQPSLDNRKSNMIAEMLDANGGDVLLEPHTVYTKEMFGKRSLTISGFVASFDNFRKASDEDLKALEIGYKNSETPVYNVAKKPLFANLKKDEKVRKQGSENLFKITVGFTGSGLVRHYASEDRKMGYLLNFEYQRLTPSNFYYNASFGFASRGFHLDYSEMMSHVFNIMPVGVGYNLQLNDSFSLFANLGWYMDISMVDDGSYSYSWNSRVSAAGIFDTGFKYGVGLKYGRYSLELMNYSGFIGRFYDNNNSEHYKQKSLSLSLGVTF